MSQNLDVHPLVSIVVPVFNGEKYLRESLDSIVNQTYPHIEILVMDDASTDSTPEIVAGYGDLVKYHQQEHNKGIYDNSNDGIVFADGEYVAIYHADDIYDPYIVEREVEFLNSHPDVGAVFSKDIFVDSENREYGRLCLQPEVSGGGPLDYSTVFNALLTYKNWMFVCPTAMVRASVYRDVGLYRQEQFLNTSDLEMWLRIAQKYRLAILEEYLMRYRHFSGQSSQRYNNLRTATGRFFSIMDLYLEKDGRNVATPTALAAYEAHRSEDQLMIAVNHYILNQSNDAITILNKIKMSRLLGSRRIQRGRLTVLFAMLYVLLHIPRISFVADWFHHRWHVEKPWTSQISAQ